MMASKKWSNVIYLVRNIMINEGDIFICQCHLYCKLFESGCYARNAITGMTQRCAERIDVNGNAAKVDNASWRYNDLAKRRTLFVRPI